jgi:Mrp family chromosome partitioning ATPase
MTDCYRSAMAEAGPQPGVRALERFLAMLKRRWPVVLVITIVAGSVALLNEQSHEEKVVASTDVYLTRLDLAGAYAQLPDNQNAQPIERWMETQAELARVPPVAQDAVAHLPPSVRIDPSALLGASSVNSHPNADLLSFSVTDAHPAAATALAGAYADAFVRYRRDLDRATIQSSIDEIQKEIDRLTPPKGTQETQLRFSLQGVLGRLEGAKALQTANATVVRAPGIVGKVENEPLKAGLAGAALGFVVGLAVALALEAISRRVRTESEISQRLDLPLLGRVPTRTRRTATGLAMRDRVDSPEAEVYRAIRAEVELVAAPELRSIMISAVDQELADSPAVAANLAIALARSSTHTILVDLDLRHRALDELFGVTGRPGLTEVVAGRLSLEAALVTAWSGETVPFASEGTDVLPDQGALLQLLPAGTPASSVGDLVASPRLHQVLQAVVDHASVVVFHGPPVIGTADALTLTDAVDGLILVAGLHESRRNTLDEVREEMAGAVDCLGVIVTGKKPASATELRGGRLVTPRAGSRAPRPPRHTETGATPLGVAAQQIRR